MSINPIWLDDSGNLRSLAQVLEAKNRAARAAEIARDVARKEAEALKSETQKRLDNAQKALADAKFTGDRSRIELWRDHVANLKDQVDIERRDAERKAAFAADRRIALIREEAGLIEKSGASLYPSSDQTERDVLVQIARSNDWPDPESQYRAYREIAEQLDNREIEAARVRANEHAESMALAGAQHAESMARAAEIRQAQARREGVADESTDQTGT
jgi:hypothetical protein